MFIWLCYCNVSGWTKILQYYANSYTPTPNAVGDVSKIFASGFAKLSDVKINEIVADSNGYYYYKLQDIGDPHQGSLLVRTVAKFQDTARAFGWSKNFLVCTTWDVQNCAWKNGVNSDESNFDSFSQTGDTCNRWFTDNTGPVQCHNAGTTGQRCFSKGKSCSWAIRANVVMYKWSPRTGSLHHLYVVFS